MHTINLATSSRAPTAGSNRSRHTAGYHAHVTYPGMIAPQPFTRDLWCTKLCPHGPDHVYLICPYAHALSELRAPAETRIRYNSVWRQHGVDRFYGQYMTPQQLHRFAAYWNHPPHEHRRPNWAAALFILHYELENIRGMAYPWDFGLTADIQGVVDYRNAVGGPAEAPFVWYPRLWERLLSRRFAMQNIDLDNPDNLVMWGYLRQRSSGPRPVEHDAQEALSLAASSIYSPVSSPSESGEL